MNCFLVPKLHLGTPLFYKAGLCRLGLRDELMPLIYKVSKQSLD